MFQSVTSMWSIGIVDNQLSPLSCKAICLSISETDCPYYIWAKSPLGM